MTASSGGRLLALHNAMFWVSGHCLKTNQRIDVCRVSTTPRSPVVDMRACGGGRLLALHDATFSMDSAPLLPQRNVLRSIDLDRQVSFH